MVDALSDESLLKMISSPSTKNNKNNYSSVDVEKSIANIKTGDISQVKFVRKYRIPRRNLAIKCNKKERVCHRRGQAGLLYCYRRQISI